MASTPRVSFDDSVTQTYHVDSRPHYPPLHPSSSPQTTSSSSSGAGASSSSASNSPQASTSRGGGVRIAPTPAVVAPKGREKDEKMAMEINDRYAQALRDDQILESHFELHQHEAGEKTPLASEHPPHHQDHLIPPPNPTRKPEAYASESDPDTSGFDWDRSSDSDLDETEKAAKRAAEEREREEEHGQRIKRAKRLRRVCLGFMMLARPLRTGIIMLLGSGICITPAIIVWTRFPDTSVRPHVLIWSIWISVAVACACITSILVDFFPTFVLKIVLVLYGSTPESLKTQVELWMTVKFWTKLALGLTWDWVAILVILNTFFKSERDSGQLSYFKWVVKANAALFGTGLVLLVEKILLQMIKLNFHRTSLAGRLEENAKALWALDKLAAAKDIRRTPKRRGRFGAFTSSRGNSRRPSFDNSPQNQKSSGTASRSGRNSPGKPLGEDPVVLDMPLTPSAADQQNPMSHARTGSLFRRRSKGQDSAPAPQSVQSAGVGGQGQEGGVAAAALEKELHRAKREHAKASGHSRQSSMTPFHARDLADQLTNALSKATLKSGGAVRAKEGFGSTHSAKKLARKLFEGLDEDRGGCITKNEFEPFFRNAGDAAQAFALFDKDGNGDISRKEMRSAVSRIYRERRALAGSLKDMSSAVGKLDAVLLSVSLLIIIFIWLFIFNPSGTTAELVPIATIVLGFSFVFGNSAKNLFESMLFIFSIHPYDVGDLVFIDDQPLNVMAFGLFSTTFKRVDGQVMVAPNSLLGSSKYILNVTRSPAMWEVTNVQMGFDTPFTAIQDFRTRLRQYVADNPREWGGGLDVHVDFMENQNLIQLIIAMQHKVNWANWGGRWARRTLLMREIKTILDDLNVTYRAIPQPVSFVPKGGPAPFRGRLPGSDSFGSPSRGRSSSVSAAGQNNQNVFGNAGFVHSDSQTSFTRPRGQLPTLRVETGQSFRSGSATNR